MWRVLVNLDRFFLSFNNTAEKSMSVTDQLSKFALLPFMTCTAIVNTRSPASLVAITQNTLVSQALIGIEFLAHVQTRIPAGSKYISHPNIVLSGKHCFKHKIKTKIFPHWKFHSPKPWNLHGYGPAHDTVTCIGSTFIYLHKIFARSAPSSTRARPRTRTRIALQAIQPHAGL